MNWKILFPPSFKYISAIGLFLSIIFYTIARTAPPDYVLTLNEIVASGFTHPVQVTHAGDGSGRLFVVEQPGTIKIIKNGAVLSTPFLDIRSLVSYGGERGLLGIAFHPDYTSNGYFYIDYTNVDGNTVIARYQVSTDPDIADPNSAIVILAVNQPYANHNGGQLLFGADRYLYIGMGDGGSGGDPQNNAQDITSLLGKILRIDVDHGLPYTIPADNPYVGKSGADEIWALGLRNPWRFSFDRQTGDQYIGDVGQNTYEEIDFQKFATSGGVNYGWRCREGFHAYTTTSPCNNPGYLAQLTDPILEYSHAVGQSITGGFVYRGSQSPAMAGVYFYGDYVQGKIWSIKLLDRNLLTWSTPQLELTTGFSISSFGEDEEGELYVVNYSGGAIYHLADANRRPNLSASTKYPSTPWANPGEIVTYTIRLSNTGGALPGTATLSDTISGQLNYVNHSLAATSGSIDDSQAPILNWTGSLNSGATITVTYQVQVTSAITGSILNLAELNSPYIQSLELYSELFVPRPVITSTHNDFFVPGSQPGSLITPLLDSVDCDTCHSAPIYDTWRGSMMSQAGHDPLMWAALGVANNYAPNSGEFCLRCHSPNGWFAGRSASSDGSLLLTQDIDNGVSCQTCHRMVDPLASPGVIDEAETLDNSIRQALSSPPPADYLSSGMMVIDPNDNRRGPFSLGSVFNYHKAYRTDFLGQNQDAVTEARLCATCHNVNNPTLAWDAGRGQFWPNTSGQPASTFEKGQLFPIEQTYEEWVLSDYANGGVFSPNFAGAKLNKIVETCQDCHIPRSTGVAADLAFNPMIRDCRTTGCLPKHDLVGGNTWMPDLLQDAGWRLSSSGQSSYLIFYKQNAARFLSKAATLEVALQENAGSKTATVKVINQTGHKLPTGYPEGRRMWIHFQAYDQSGNLVYESGAYDANTGQLTLDPDIKIYEVKQGLTPEWAAILGLPSGPSFHFVLNNTTHKDNRIPPRGYNQMAFDQPGLRPVGAIYSDGQYWDITTYDVPANTARIKATLYYQLASKEYIEFLTRFGGVDGNTVGKLWENLKSPPQVIQSGWYPNYPAIFPMMMNGTVP